MIGAQAPMGGVSAVIQTASPMAKNRNPRLPSDSELDRATDIEYASISTMAVLGVVTVACVPLLLAAVWWAWGFGTMMDRMDGPLVWTLPMLAVVLGIVSLIKIRRSGGVQIGAKIAMAAIVCGSLMFVGFGGRQALDAWQTRTLNQELGGRALAVVDDLRGGEYGKVFAEMPGEYRDRIPTGASGLRERMAPLFDGCGPFVTSQLKTLLPTPPTKQGLSLERAEVYVEYERRYLLFEVWFRPMPDGKWAFIGVGGQETLESEMKFTGGKHPAPVVGPYQLTHEHDHGE
jgi:hypothetical protein